MSPGPPCQEAWRVDSVFTATVLEIVGPQRLPVAERRTADHAAERIAFPKRVVRLEVQEAFVGLDGLSKKIEIQTGMGGGDCGYPFETGMEYLVYAHKSPEGTLKPEFVRALIS